MVSSRGVSGIAFCQRQFGVHPTPSPQGNPCPPDPQLQCWALRSSPSPGEGRGEKGSGAPCTLPQGPPVNPYPAARASHPCSPSSCGNRGLRATGTGSHQHPQHPRAPDGTGGGAGRCLSPSKGLRTCSSLPCPHLPVCSSPGVRETAPSQVRGPAGVARHLGVSQATGRPPGTLSRTCSHSAGTHWSASAWPASLPGCWARETRLLVVT